MKTFDFVLLGLLSILAAVKFYVWSSAPKSEAGKDKGSKLEKLHYNYLVVFWLFRAADWVQGPYFYEVYATKRVNGELLGTTAVSALFLCGFVSSGICGSFVGSLVDKYGRKSGCMAFCVLYALSALSTKSSSLPVLVMGRILGGIATSLLYSAPEAWFVAQHVIEYEGKDGAKARMGACFDWMWFGDSIVAIIVGQLANAVVSRGESDDPTAAFMLSIAFLALALCIIASTWAENYGKQSTAVGTTGSTLSQVQDTLAKMRADPKILLCGAISSLFEGAMFVFVLAWPRSVIAAMGDAGPVPWGKIFSCFMVCCMVGSSFFSPLLRKYSIEAFMVAVLSVAAMALLASAVSQGSLVVLLCGFFIFEGTVGLYFPSIGMLRSKYIPNEFKTTALNIFRIPLNLIVVGINLSVSTIGTTGALFCSATLLVGAALAQRSLLKVERKAAKTTKTS